MRNLVLLAGAAMCWAVPAAAQSGLDGRVGKLESEMRAVQRKVFPGGAVPSVEPQITGAPVPGRDIGSPATQPLADLTQRVSSLEQQTASLTGQIEQVQYRQRQLEEQFAAYRKEMDARLSSATPTPGGAGGPVESTGPVTPASQPGRKPETPPATAPAASKDPARAKLVAAIEHPKGGQPDEDDYIYGYRLWQAKFYPEAVTQLKKVVTDYPRSRRASYAQNLVGRAYLDDGKPSLASIAFYDNYKKMPDGERAPESLYYLGQSLIKLNKPADACKVYGELSDVYGEKISAQMQGDITRARGVAKCK